MMAMRGAMIAVVARVTVEYWTTNTEAGQEELDR